MPSWQLGQLKKLKTSTNGCRKANQGRITQIIRSHTRLSQSFSLYHFAFQRPSLSLSLSRSRSPILVILCNIVSNDQFKVIPWAIGKYITPTTTWNAIHKRSSSSSSNSTCNSSNLISVAGWIAFCFFIGGFCFMDIAQFTIAHHIILSWIVSARNPFGRQQSMLNLSIALSVLFMNHKISYTFHNHSHTTRSCSLFLAAIAVAVDFFI